MKATVLVVFAMFVIAFPTFAEEFERRDACASIPRRALERAERSLKESHPNWGALPTTGEDGEWRCRTSGTYVRRYDRIIDNRRLVADIPLSVDKEGSIFICDGRGCFSLDRWK